MYPLQCWGGQAQLQRQIDIGAKLMTLKFCNKSMQIFMTN